MKSLLFDGPPLFRRILFSILLASVFFLSLLTLIVYYSNEILEYELLDTQTEYELDNALELLARDPAASLPNSARLGIYLDSRDAQRPVPRHLRRLDDGSHHDIEVDNRAYHVLVTRLGDDRIYIQTDITAIERSEHLLATILLSAWVATIVMVFGIALVLSRRLADPIMRLCDELTRLDPDRRGVRLGERFADDEVGRIARAFDTYSERMDDYVEKQMAFAAMASHELRSPLTIVTTSADLIATRHREADIAPHLDKIRRAATQMAYTIHALLAVTRERSPSGEFELLALRPMVDEIIGELAAEARNKDIEIDNRVTASATLEADRTLLFVVLSNLIRNAVKHGRRCVIGIDYAAPTITISDDGQGIGAEELDRIFEFGRRGGESRGFGVGLYISRLVCDFLGWKLSLEPNPGGGLLARVEFPS